MKLTCKEQAIGIFDSGVGGLTVWKAIASLLPQESLLYFGDTARVPYGEKSGASIVRFAEEIGDFLIQKKIKALVVACNTATAHALKALKKRYTIPIIGVIEPGVSLALKARGEGEVAVLGTQATIRSGVYQGLLSPHCAVHPVACPLFAPLAEEGMGSHAAAKLIAKEYLSPLKQRKVTAALLGCTHYPLLKALIQEELGAQVTLIDSAEACALKVKEVLGELDLLATCSLASYQFIVSDDPILFQAKAKKLLGVLVKDCKLAVLSS